MEDLHRLPHLTNFLPNLDLTIGQSIGYTAAGLGQHSHFWLDSSGSMAEIVVSPTRVHVHKWGHLLVGGGGGGLVFYNIWYRGFPSIQLCLAAYVSS
jgi:hypothetical protein